MVHVLKFISVLKQMIVLSDNTKCNVRIKEELMLF